MTLPTEKLFDRQKFAEILGNILVCLIPSDISIMLLSYRPFNRQNGMDDSTGDLKVHHVQWNRDWNH